MHEKNGPFSILLVHIVVVFFSNYDRYFCVFSQRVLGKILVPITWLLGVDISECETVGRLIGLKMTINEFVAYKQMGELIKEGQLNVSVVRCNFTESRDPLNVKTTSPTRLVLFIYKIKMCDCAVVVGSKSGTSFPIFLWDAKKKT